MLERISNISLDTDFKKSKKGRYSQFKGELFSNSAFDVNDSISFSSASKYLSRAGWLLKEFKQTAGDKVVVEFNYYGFHFEVSLDLERINNIETVIYSIKKDGILVSPAKLIQTSFKITIGGFDINYPMQKELKGLDQLFQRFETLELNNELNLFNYELIDTLLDGFYTSLQSDFTYLNIVLFHFLEKQTNRKFDVLFNKNKDANTRINILKIRPNTYSIEN